MVFSINPYVKIWPPLWPHSYPGVMILTNLNLHHLRLLLHKLLQLFWPIDFWTDFLKVSLEISRVVLEKKIKLWKLYDDDNNWQILNRKALLSLQLRWVKNSFFLFFLSHLVYSHSQISYTVLLDSCTLYQRYLLGCRWKIQWNSYNRSLYLLDTS